MMKITKETIFPLLLLFAVLTIHTTSNASTTNTRKANVTSTIKWDITGDGKEDTISFVPEGYNKEIDGSNKLSVYVNGEYQYTSSSDWYYEGYSFTTIALKNKAKYIFLELHEIDEDDTEAILRYKNGKLYRESTPKTTIGKLGYRFDGTYYKTVGNKVYFHAISMSYGLARLKFDAVYQYKNGKLKPASKYHKVISYGRIAWGKGWKTKRLKLTVNKPIKIYKDATGKKYVKTLKSGTKVTITRLYLTNKYCSYYVKGQGWYKVKHKIIRPNPPFKGLLYAG